MKIPEFVNIPADGLLKIDAPATDSYRSYNLAWELTQKGKFDEALAQYQKGLERMPKYASSADLATVYDYMGRARAGKGDMAAAVRDFEKATRLNPSFGPHLYDYALALTQLNRFDEAQTAVEAALKANADFAEAHELPGGLYGRKRRLPEAAREYRRALDLRPDVSAKMRPHGLNSGHACLVGSSLL